MPFIPVVVDNRTSYDVFSRLLKDGIIMLSGEVNDSMADVVISQMLYLQEESPNKPIKLYINSPGGSVFDGMAIYDVMKMVSNTVETYCLGKACSMGSVLLAGGTPGHRYSLPHSKIMIHQVLGGFSGQATDIQIAAKSIQSTKEMITELISKDSGQDYAKVMEDMERDKWMTPEEAKEYGLIDHIFNYNKTETAPKKGRRK